MGFINKYKQKQLIKKGNRFYMDGKYEAALKFYNKAQDLDQMDNFSVWYNKGLAFCRIKKYLDALECYDNAIKLDSKDPKA